MKTVINISNWKYTWFAEFSFGKQWKLQLKCLVKKREILILSEAQINWSLCKYFFSFKDTNNLSTFCFTSIRRRNTRKYINNYFSIYNVVFSNFSYITYQNTDLNCINLAKNRTASISPIKSQSEDNRQELRMLYDFINNNENNKKR